MAKLTDKDIEIQIYNGSEIIIIEPCDEVVVDWEIELTAGVLTFKVPTKATGSFYEGNNVRLYLEKYSKDKAFFSGYVFTKRRNKNQIIDVTVFDQLRYLQMKDVYQIEAGKTVTDVVKEICTNRGLEIGELFSSDKLNNTPIRPNIYEDEELIKVLAEVIDYASVFSGSEGQHILVLYDDDGKIILNDAKNMVVNDYVIGYGNLVDFEYTTSIDEGVYNRIKIITDNGVEIREDLDSISKWGILQYTAKDNQTPFITTTMDNVLEMTNKLRRKLELKGVLGDVRVRQGSIIRVYFPALGDINLKDAFMVTKVTHRFKAGQHLMDLSILNDDFMEPSDIDSMFEYRENTETGGEGGGGGDLSYRPLTGADLDIPSVAGNQKAFGDMIAPHAIDNYFIYGVLPSVTIAMAIWESGSGSSYLARNGKALFGIKYSSSKPDGMNIVSGSRPTDGNMQGTYRHYESYYDSIKDHGHFLRNNSRYANVFNQTTAAAQLQAIMAAGYAESGYLTNAINISNRFKHYDEMALRGEGGTGMYKKGDSYKSLSHSNSSIEDQIIKAAEKYIGYPYNQFSPGLPPRPSSPSQNTGAHDCSSFCRAVMWDVFKTDVGGNTWEQLKNPNLRTVTGQPLKVGDLIFPHDGHVQLYIGNNRTLNASTWGVPLGYSGVPTQWVVRRYKDL